MKQQRRHQDVCIGDRADQRHSPDRAQATAFFTSVSESPSSASFARTPSARLTRTGVSTTRPFSVVTSKYSVASTAAVTDLGSVNQLVLGGQFGEHDHPLCGGFKVRKYYFLVVVLAMPRQAAPKDSTEQVNRILLYMYNNIAL